MNSNTDSGIHVHRLDNGFTIALERLPHLHSASFGLWIKAGSAAEQPVESGIAHFLEHLFFKGTHTRNVHQIMDAVESRGGYLNASTSREYTTLYVRMLEKHVGVGIDVLADIAINSTFNDLEKERGVILEEIASAEDTPDEFIHDLLSEHHWPNHALGRPIYGSAETVSQLRFEDFRRFFNTWYKPENMVFSVAGNFNEEETLALVTEKFENLAVSTAPPMDGVPQFQAGIRMVERPISQTHIGIAFPGPTATDDARYQCSLLSGVLGGGGTSRLFEIIREQEGLAYSVYAYNANYTTTGMTGVYAAVAPHNTERTLDLTFAELRKIRSEPVRQEELDCSREQLKGAMLMALENTQARMSRMAKGLLFMGRVIPVEEIIEKIDAITCEDLLEFAQEHIQAESCALLLLGPSDTPIPTAVAL